MKFSDFDLDPRCQSVLDTEGFTEPTPIQGAAIPLALKGVDLIATAQTGTGKTLAFALPALTRLGAERNIRNRMLVLVPTRELAIQVGTVIAQFSKAHHLKSTLIYGGVGFGEQIDDLKRGVDIIVATPGRLLDHIGQGRINFKDLEVLVFDEADRMLDMGFLPDIQRILSRLPDNRQTMMFSATFAPELQRLSQRMMHEPEIVSAGPIAKPVDKVRQLLIPVRQEEKSRILLEYLEEEEGMSSAIVFMRTKRRTDRLGRLLSKAGYHVAVIHGDLSQGQRQKAIEGFRDARFDILVATDVAARGLDIDDVSHVFNYDIPVTADDYVHRIGRTARAHRDGDAITFATPQDIVALGEIEKTLGKNLERREYEGAPPVLSTWKPAGARKAGGGRRPRGMLRRR